MRTTTQEVTQRMMALLGSLRGYVVEVFGRDYGGEDLTRRVFKDNIQEANVVTSMTVENASKHKVLLDIDYEAHLIPSSTPGHYHLYLDVPDAIPHAKYLRLIRELGKAGVIEKGYAKASIKRGHTALRVPWEKK